MCAASLRSASVAGVTATAREQMAIDIQDIIVIMWDGDRQRRFAHNAAKVHRQKIKDIVAIITPARPKVPEKMRFRELG